MAPFQQLGEVNWSLVCAACCHMPLDFAIMHLYNNDNNNEILIKREPLVCTRARYAVQKNI